MSPRQIESNNESSLSEPLLPSHLPSNREIEDERSTSTPCNQETDNAARTAEETQPQASVSRNVHLTLIYTGFAFAGRSIWNSSVLAAYVFLLKKNDLEAVGYITAVMGMTQFACSVPTGWLVDYHRRDFILKLASVAGFVAIGVTSFALWTLKFSHLVAALAAWGCCWGMANTSLSALFADSIPTGQRSLYFTRRSMILTGGVATGPIVSLIMFALLGDEWNVRDCAVVMLAGQVICFPAMVLLCFFSDDFAVEVEADAPTSTLPLQEEDNSGEGTCRSRTVSIAEDSNEVLVDVRTENEVDESSSNRCCAGSWSCTTLSESRKIAILVASADLMAGLSSAQGNPDLAVEFLTNGIPEAVTAAASAPTPAANSSSSSSQPLQALRNHPQFNDLRRLVQSNPQMLQQVLSQIGQQQPELLQEINANQPLFLQMMNEPVTEGSSPAPAPSAPAPAGGAADADGLYGMGGMDGPGNPAQMAEMINSMSQEELQQMSQMMGLTPEQLRATAQMIGQMPPEQLQQFMGQVMGGAGAGAMGGGGGAGGPQVLRLTDEEMAAVDRLTEMGFDRAEAAQAFLACDKNEALAANLLMDSMGDGGFFGGGGGGGGGDNNDGNNNDSNGGSGGDNDEDMYD
eukprot:CAMPEP_0172440478 /NCGR_PEP_ID=MMETSP1065-20121228/1094_1 /TAXON_ID=265537 /ORGANISM="Amphiprora paludosa, Strain CCMP125" /LENGTH=630 /DNA_ID=CAMNT_0013189317 /DNA_START=38 /DNA_END=1930 /DNA_ORIENTATION=-